MKPVLRAVGMPPDPTIDADAALRASESRFRRLTELSSDWYWEQDQELRFISHWGVNPSRVSARFSQDRGKTRWELPVLGVSDAQWAAHRADLEARRPFRDFEFRRRTATGEIVHVTVSGEPVFDAGGSFIGYHGVGRDITDRKRAEQMLELEHAVAGTLASVQDADAAARDVIRIVCEAEEFACGRLWQLDAEAGVLRAGATWSTGDPALDMFFESTRDKVFAPGFGLVGVVFESGDTVWVPDMVADGRATHLSLAMKIGLRSVFSVPIVAEGATVGALAFMGRDMRAPDARLIAAGRVIGSQVGQYLERKRRERELRESETRYRTLTDLSSDWYWEHDAEGRFTRSDNLGLLSGIRASEILGKTRWETGIHYDASERERIEGDMAARRPFRDFEYCRVDDTGVEHYVTTSGAPMFDAAGNYAGYRGIAKDISERRRRDVDLQRFRAAMDATADAIYLTDRAGTRFIDVNDGACRMLGYARAELLSMEPAKVFLASSLDGGFAELARLDGATGIHQIEALHQRKDGSFVPVEVHRRPQRSGDEWIIVGVARDISARLQADHSIRTNGMRQQLVAEFGQYALSVTDVNELLKRAVYVVREGLGVNHCRVVQCAADGPGVLRAGAGWMQAWSAPRLEAQGERTSIRWMLETRAPLLVGDYASETRFETPDVLREHAVRSGLEVLIGGAGAPYGILGAYARETDAFTMESANFLQSIANLLGTAVERRNAEEKLAYLAQFDSLTSLPNRDLFRERLAQTLAHARHNDSALAILYIDLDGFKIVNDTLGHGAGDKLLALVADRLKGCVRSNDTVGRLGGDEFAIVLSNLAMSSDAELVANQVVAALMRPFDVEGHDTRLTASVGISLYPVDAVDADQLLKNADSAMYRAKERGRNNFQFYTPELNDKLRRRWALERDLRRAIEQNEFELYYQPQVDFATRQIIGVEALIRWNHPERGLLASSEFIGAAEATGLIAPIGRWVVETACRQGAEWYRAGHRELFMAVNVSAVEIQRGNVVEQIEMALAASGLPPHRLEVELTESVVLQGAEPSGNVLSRLKNVGVTLAIDDFGTGYSSLSYLKHFPIDKVKIDQTFVRDIDTDPDDCAIVQAVIAMSHHLKLQVVAEGVGTERQATFLLESGCDVAQGFLFGMPMPAVKLTALLAAHPARIAPSAT